MLSDHEGSKLCVCCQSIDIENLSEGPIADNHDISWLFSIEGYRSRLRLRQHPHHVNFKALIECFNSGECDLCTLILKAVTYNLTKVGWSVTDVPFLNAPVSQLSLALKQSGVDRSISGIPEYHATSDDEDENLQGDATPDSNDDNKNPQDDARANPGDYPSKRRKADDKVEDTRLNWAGIVVLCRRDDDIGRELELLAELRVYSDNDRISSGRPVSYDITTGDLPSTMARWLKTCQLNHPLCSFHLGNKTTHGSQFMPTRVIDVGLIDTRGSFAEPHLALGCLSPGGWVALSHTWGDGYTCRLLKGNIQNNMDQIRMVDLPSTFRDAIDITRSLRIRYLWIDSLCIVQDDPADWNKEAAVMGRIYSLSSCTIAATSSRNTQDGIFRVKPPTDVISVKFDSKRFGSGVVNIQTQLSGWMSAIESYGESPLSGRAWVLQEQVLSPRTIHFASDQVYWECRESRLGQATGRVPALQAFSINSGEDLVTELYRLWTKNKLLVIPLERIPRPIVPPPPKSARIPSKCSMCSQQMTYHKYWQALVERYSCRKLTRADDVLPAISGLASIFQERLRGDQYIAGLWTKYLPEGLSWRLWGADNKSHPRYSPGATFGTHTPSWSWISTSHRITFYLPYADQSPSQHYKAQVLHTGTIPIMPTNPFGQICSSYLMVRGLSVSVTIKGDPDYQGNQKISDFGLPVPNEDVGSNPGEAHVEVYVPEASGFSNIHSEPIFPLQQDGTLLYEKIQYEPDEEDGATMLRCILDNPCEQPRSTAGVWLSFHLLHFYDRAYLMLKESNTDRGKFYRIGLAVNTLSWTEPTWPETSRDFDLI